MSRLFYGAGNAQMGNWSCEETDARGWFIRAGRVDMSPWRRGDSQYGARFRFVTLWPSSGFMTGDISAGYICPINQDVQCSDWWSPWQRANRGNGRVKFILGQCKDGAGNALGGAVVQGFLTSSDAFVGETACDDKGNYELGTPYPGQNHYLVAYYSAGNLAGTTVNTLIPTNRDGT